jgi:hypothetical protein
MAIGSGIGLAAAVAATLLAATPAEAYSYSALGGTVTHKGAASATYLHGSREHQIGVGVSTGVYRSVWIGPQKTIGLTVTGSVYGPFTYHPAVR